MLALSVCTAVAARWADPLLFAFRESTLPGKLILLLLFVGSIFSWSVMVTKIRVIQYARRRTEAFLEQFRADRLPLRMYESGHAYDGAPIFEVYHAGCQEMTFHLLGSTEVDETFHSRLEIAEKVTPAQLRAVSAVMERAVGEEALRLESQLILLSTAVSGAPFLGLLGTVWGVMDTFTGVAIAGKPNLAAMAPGVSGALITTVIALLVAIPAMFGYNFILTSIRSLIVQMDNFAAELESEFEHKYVSHGADLDGAAGEFSALEADSCAAAFPNARVCARSRRSTSRRCSTCASCCW